MPGAELTWIANLARNRRLLEEEQTHKMQVARSQVPSIKKVQIHMDI